MKSVLILFALTLSAASAQANDLVFGIYQSITDPQGCVRLIDEEAESGITFECPPARTDFPSVVLHRGNDYDHLLIVSGDVSFSTWEQMLQVGGFSGVGNEKGIVEWVGRKIDGRILPEGLIVRFSGVANLESMEMRSRLAVYGFNRDSITGVATGVCFKGLAKINEEARSLVSGPCVLDLLPEPNY